MRAFTTTQKNSANRRGNLPLIVLDYSRGETMPTIEKQSSQAARLNFRLPPEIKERIENAAFVSGVTITDFAITALANTAEEVLERHQTRVLSDRDRDIFLAMLEDDSEPNEALKKAVEEYKRRVISR